MESILIKDTTRAQREEIVRRSLAACGGSCEGCNGCDNLGGGRIETLYQPYIDGCQRRSDFVVFRQLKNAGKQRGGNV